MRGLLVTLGKLGENVAPEHLQRLAHVLVAVAAHLAEQDHLVATGFLVAPEELAHLLGRADRAAQRVRVVTVVRRRERAVDRLETVPVVAGIAAVALEVVPEARRTVRVRRPVVVVVRERVREEVRSLEAAVERGLLVGMAHQRGDDGELGVDGEPGGDAVLGVDDGEVVLDPAPCLFRFGQHREAECTEPVGRGDRDHLGPGAGHPQRGMGSLERLRHDVARRHLQPLAVVAVEGLLDEHPRDGVE